jgi:hypothetical protein
MYLTVASYAHIISVDKDNTEESIKRFPSNIHLINVKKRVHQTFPIKYTSHQCEKIKATHPN